MEEYRTIQYNNGEISGRGLYLLPGCVNFYRHLSKLLLYCIKGGYRLIKSFPLSGVPGARSNPECKFDKDQDRIILRVQQTYLILFGEY